MLKITSIVNRLFRGIGVFVLCLVLFTFFFLQNDKRSSRETAMSSINDISNIFIDMFGSRGVSEAIKAL